MSSILNSQAGVVLATAMAAVSGTVILLAFRTHKTPDHLRPCLLSSSDGNQKLKKSRKKKSVHFAEDVVEPIGNGVEFRKRHRKVSFNKSTQPPSSFSTNCSEIDDSGEQSVSRMPANRVALYNGMIRDRVGYRCY